MDAVVAADFASVDADCDNGAALYGMPRHGRCKGATRSTLATAKRLPCRGAGQSRSPRTRGIQQGESLCTPPTCGDGVLVITESRSGVSRLFGQGYAGC